MSKDSGAQAHLSYRKIRDISTKEEDRTRSIVSAVFRNSQSRDRKKGNLRAYIPAHPGKKRSMVHKSYWGHDLQ